MRSLPLLTIALALAAGCTGSSSNATLADLPNVRVVVQTWAPSDTKATLGYVDLSYDWAAFRAAHGGDCATVDLSGTRNGHDLETDGGGNSDELEDCYSPSLGLSGDFSGAQTIEITDGTTTIAAAYGGDALAPHTPALVAPAEWKLSAGDHAEVTWSAPGDLAQLAPEPFQVYFHTGTNEENNAFDLTPSMEQDRISWTMPSPLPRTGKGLIVFRLGYTNGTADTCTGASACTYSAERGYEHSVTLAP